jgi:predicted RNA-binding protein
MNSNYNIETYPGFPEYKLIDLYPIEKIHYKRGNDYKNLFSEDYSIWQDYFCQEYMPPEGKDTILFHTCSWSKPYDFSFIVKPIRDIANKYQNIHRIILSNVGVIPYEYQMNPTFCSYDCPPILTIKDGDDKEKEQLRKDFINVHYKRIYRYIASHVNQYKKVIIYAKPIKYSAPHLITLICKELNIPCENVIDKELYTKYQNKEYEDSGEIFIESEILGKLDSVLKSNSK